MNSKEIVLTFNRKGLTLEKALAIGAGQAAEIIEETNHKKILIYEIFW